MFATSDEKVNVEYFISERTHKPNALRFSVEVWCLYHVYDCSWPDAMQCNQCETFNLSNCHNI